MIGLDWSREGLFDNEVAHLFYTLIKDTKQGIVTAVTAKQKTKAPPPALHTVELLRVASSKLHIGPKQAMDVAERLYIEVSQCRILEGTCRFMYKLCFHVGAGHGCVGYCLQGFQLTPIAVAIIICLNYPVHVCAAMGKTIGSVRLSVSSKIARSRDLGI